MEKRLEWLMMLQLHRSDTHSSDAVDRFVTTAALNFLRGFRTIELSFDFLHAEFFFYSVLPDRRVPYRRIPVNMVHHRVPGTR